MPYETSFQFDSVFVIESLAKDDLGGLSGTWLAKTILQPLARSIPNFSVLLQSVQDRSELFYALRRVHDYAASQGHSPILHLEAHGREGGIEVASGEIVAWAELTDILTAINHRTRFNLLVVLAMCSGYYLSSTLLPTRPAPVWALIGPKKEVWSGDLQDSVAAFYKSLLGSLDAREAIYMMNRGQTLAESEYKALTAEVMFCHAFEKYVETKCTVDQLKDRENEIVAELCRRRGYDLSVAMVARHDARRMLRQHGEYFEHFKYNYFMLEYYPENASRFPLAYVDCGGAA